MLICPKGNKEETANPLFSSRALEANEVGPQELPLPCLHVPLPNWSCSEHFVWLEQMSVPPQTQERHMVILPRRFFFIVPCLQIESCQTEAFNYLLQVYTIKTIREGLSGLSCLLFLLLGNPAYYIVHCITSRRQSALRMDEERIHGFYLLCGFR